MPLTPYTPPHSNPEKPHAEGTELSELTLAHLLRTRLWVKLCSIVGFAACIFLLVIGTYIVEKTLHTLTIHQSCLIGGFYFILSILFYTPSYYLLKYEISITHLSVSHQLEDLEQALADQHIFWRLAALMSLAIIIILLLTLALTTLFLIKLIG